MDTIKVEKKSQKRLSMSECAKKEFLKALPTRKCIVIDLNLESVGEKTNPQHLF